MTKELEHIEELEEKNAELELKIKKLTQHLEPQSMTALFEQVEEEVKQEQRLNELEKENAELKEIKKSYEEIIDNSSITLMKEKLKNYKQITKVKELLNEFMRISKASDEDFEYDYSELIKEAKQFLEKEQ